MKIVTLFGGVEKSLQKGKTLAQKTSKSQHISFQVNPFRVQKELWTESLASHLFCRQPRNPASHAWGFKFFEDFAIAVPIHCALLGTFNT